MTEADLERTDKKADAAEQSVNGIHGSYVTSQTLSL